ncbi:response regulator transcription factor [Empedobacter brevis]|uniref:Response regulator transcription factor n=2 Tax=Empedobacter brevis TaxID=247 RepID=A0AAJ1QGX9_9FLAO|nr:response regulator transcription factor [Empedobacter brevis]
MRLYTLNMYESLTWHYAQNENWEKAYKTRIIVNQLATDYDAGNQSGKIQSLEREILNKRNDLELRNQKNIKFFLGTTSVIFIILLLVLFKLYKTNQEKRKLVENENNRIRAKLSDLMNKVNDKEITLSNYQLSDRQLEIIDLVKKGLTNKEIATQLYISENTVKYHLKIIYNTLGIDSRNSL